MTARENKNGLGVLSDMCKLNLSAGTTQASDMKKQLVIESRAAGCTCTSAIE